MALGRTDSIPRLTDLEYLSTSLELLDQSPTFESVRNELIAVSRRRADNLLRIPRSGYGVSRRIYNADNLTYWTNARDVLAELINLGVVQETTVPSKRRQVDAYRDKKYQLTLLGKDLVAKKRADEFEYHVALLHLMYRRHPYLRLLLKVLGRRDVYVPTYRLPGRRADSQQETEATIAMDAYEQFIKKADELGISHADAKSLKERLLSTAKDAPEANGAGQPKSPLVDAINDIAARWFITSQGLPFDTVTFDTLYRLTEQFHITNHGFLRKDTPTLVVFSTAEVRDSPSFSVERRRISDYADRITGLIPEEFQAFANPFVPVYDLRLAVCLRAKVDNVVFDRTLEQLIKGKIEIDYQVSLLRDMPGVLPPSAEPFVLDGQIFFRVTLSKKVKEEN